MSWRAASAAKIPPKIPVFFRREAGEKGIEN
jgi:hypothetical protein